uniref:Putative conserved secreted protein n=1 Tax=Lutzomyia longipalpis TaxID=7200 RepID=A0A7G3AG81_LUTLO
MLRLRIFLQLFLGLIIFGEVFMVPMVYKKTDREVYEADLVPVSSTVIPLTVYEVSYGNGGKVSDDYKKTILKHLHSKMKIKPENPDKLITWEDVRDNKKM